MEDLDYNPTELPVKLYMNPNGHMRVIGMTEIDEEDIAFFLDNDIIVSMEEIETGFVVYGCPSSDLSEESEVIVFAKARGCRETMKALREECEKRYLCN